MQAAHTFVSLAQLAARLDLPATWLRTEADAGRIPSIRAGRRVVFHVDSVVRALTSKQPTEEAEVTCAH